MLRLEKSKLYIYIFCFRKYFFCSILVILPICCDFSKKEITLSLAYIGLLICYLFTKFETLFAATVTIIRISKFFGHLF